MVGALADWFAVTALFRHPLGIPIPHTAIIPNRKDQIGRSLGEFVEGNFLTRECCSTGCTAWGSVSGSVAGCRPGPPGTATAAIGDTVQGIIEVLDDRHVQEALGGTSSGACGRPTWRRCSARVLDASVDGGHLQRLLDVGLDGRGLVPPSRSRPSASG